MPTIAAHPLVSCRQQVALQKSSSIWQCQLFSSLSFGDGVEAAAATATSYEREMLRDGEGSQK
jgi:hypothetical protein